MASSYRRWALLIVVWAAALRLSGMAWDGWQMQHPDERFLLMVAGQLELPHTPAQVLDPARTPLNPNNRGFDFYVYGALPPVLVRAVAGAAGISDLRGMLVVGRCLAGLAGVLTTLLIMGLGVRLGGGRAGLLAGALFASCPLLIQQARFATADVWGMLFVVLAAWAVVGREATPKRMRYSLLALSGVAVGLAAASKPNLVLALAIPVTVLALEGWKRRRERHWWRTAAAAAGVALVAFLVLKVVDPGAFASMLSPLPNARRLGAIRELAAILSGSGQYPPNLQWADRRALLDPLANLLLWGTGPLLGLAVVFGVATVGRRALLGERAWLPILVWMVPTALWHLTAFVASVRHLEPLLPFAIAAAAVWLSRRRPWQRTAVVAGTAMVGLLWASIAWRPYTRIEASRWLAEHLRAGSTVTAEYWDDALPLAGTGPADVRVLTTHVFDPDTASKREKLLGALERTDAVVLSSQRGVGTICRVPDTYPVTAEYYHLLFSGALGFRLAAHFERRIGVGSLSLSDLGAEESLSVYDHPPVWIFVKTPAYSPALARALLARVPLGPERWQTRDLEARGTPPYQTRWRDAGALPGGFSTGAAGQMWAVLLWLVWVELAGLAGRRLLLRFAPSLPDRGWGAARWLGMVAAGLVWLWCGWIGVPGWNRWLPTVVAVAALPWGWRELRRVWRQREYRSTAALVWGAFAIFLAIRAFNPEVYWGEKPMDASILASIWRAGRLPPVDPWFAGSPLHYYFFGFLPYALPARAFGISAGVAFNLIAATVPALTVGCAAAVAWLLSKRAGGGVLGAVLAQLAGTAAVVFHPALLGRAGFNAFWASSRVIPGTINEYPVWSALFADLHAHFFGFPGLLAGVLAASCLALGRLRRGGAWLAGGVLAVEAMTNTWELPVLAALFGLAIAVGHRPFASWRSGVRWLSWAAGCCFAALALSAPYWLSVRSAAAGVWMTRAPAAGLRSLVELFGPAVVLVLVALAVTLLMDRPGPEVAWGWVVIGLGLGLVAAPGLVTVADHMNTVFKLHLQAHLLLAVGLAGVIAAGVPELHRPARLAVSALIGVVLAVGLLTGAAGARVVLTTRRVAGPRPTLDGWAYLAVAKPAQRGVLARLAGLRTGSPVLEPPGEPYSDTLRVPMFTGMPAVAGWRYHLWQRRHSDTEIDTRLADITRLMQGTDDGMVRALARRYRVGGAVSWDGRTPAVARALGWQPAFESGDAALFLAPEEERR